MIWDLRKEVAKAVRNVDDPVEAVLAVIDRGLVLKCDDPDCVRLWPHSRVAQHLWRHEEQAPRDRRLFGWSCWSCGRYGWRRIHRVRKGPS